MGCVLDVTVEGVSIVTVLTSEKGKILNRPRAMIRLIEEEFLILEHQEHGLLGSTVIVLVFRPRPARDSRGKSTGPCKLVRG